VGALFKSKSVWFLLHRVAMSTSQCEVQWTWLILAEVECRYAWKPQHTVARPCHLRLLKVVYLITASCSIAVIIRILIFVWFSLTWCLTFCRRLKTCPFRKSRPDIIICGVNFTKCSNTKITVSQKYVNIFVPNFAHLFTRQLCKSVLLCAVFTWHTPN